MRRFARVALAVALAAAATIARRAAAESIIKQPGNHPSYAFEAEPHLSLDPFGDTGLGPGFRGTFVVVDNGFVDSINNSIGIGTGLDLLFYGDHCPKNAGCRSRRNAIVPVVMQWNFWLHPNWSVFGEPGLAFRFGSGFDKNFGIDWFTIYGGGRYHFSDSVALTLRLNAPFWPDSTVSIGASFLL